MKFFNDYARIIINVIYDYVDVICNVILHRNTYIEERIKKNNVLEPEAFFLMNLVIIEIFTFLISKSISIYQNKPNYSFVLPMIGNVNPSHIVSILGYCIGMCIVSLIIQSVYKITKEKTISILCYSSAFLGFSKFLMLILYVLAENIFFATLNDTELLMYSFLNPNFSLLGNINEFANFVKYWTEISLLIDIIVCVFYLICVLLCFVNVKDILNVSILLIGKSIAIIIILLSISVFESVSKPYIYLGELKYIQMQVNDIKELSLKTDSVINEYFLTI